MNCDYITSQAKTLADTYAYNPYEAADDLGVVVKYKDLGTLKGLFISLTPKPAIIINENLDETTQKIVCAHELGHFILHNNTNFSCENINFDSRASIGTLEREANIFAAFFLINKEEALTYIKSGLSISETASLINTDVNLLAYVLNVLGYCNAPDSSFLK